MAITLNRLGTYTGASAGTGAAYELPDGDNVALFKVLYGPEVLANFKKNLVFGRATKVKTITSGKGYEFNLLAEVSAAYHYPGEELSGQTIARGTRQVFLDGMLTSHVYVHELDELLAHTDERSRYAESMGYKLAVAYDAAIAAEIIRGALVKPVDGIEADIAKGGTILEKDISGATDPALTLFKAILELGKELDKKSVPKNSRILVLRPEYYWMLLENIDLINSYHPGIGSISNGNVLKIAGFTILESLNIPSDAKDVEKHEIPSEWATYSAVDTNADGTADTLQGDTASAYNNLSTNAVIGSTTLTYKKFFAEAWVSKVVGVAYVPNSIVTLKRKGLVIETAKYLDKLSTLIVARMVVGHGWLNPAGCAMIIDHDPADNYGQTAIVE